MLADPPLKRKRKSTTQEPTLLLSTKTQKEFIDSHILMGKFSFERIPEFLPEHVSEGEVGEEAGGLRAGQVGGTRIPDEEEGEGVIREVNLEGSGGPYLVGDSNVGSMW